MGGELNEPPALNSEKTILNINKLILRNLFLSKNRPDKSLFYKVCRVGIKTCWVKKSSHLFWVCFCDKYWLVDNQFVLIL